MYKTILIISVILSINMFPQTMNVYTSNGSVNQYNIAEIDSITFSLSDTTNLVQNPSFEDDLNFWDPFQYTSGWSVSTNNPQKGIKCALFDFPAGVGYYDASIRGSGYQIQVEAGVEYYFSFWIREKNTHDTFDTTKTIVDPLIKVNGINYVAPTPAHSESWQFVDTTLIFTEFGIAEVQFQLHGYSETTQAEFAIDNIVFRRND